MSTASNTGHKRAPFYPSDSLWMMQMAAKAQGRADPYCMGSILLLKADGLGRLQHNRLTSRERDICRICAKTELGWHTFYSVERHHLNGDRGDNRRENLMLVFAPVHKMLSDPIGGPSNFVRRQHVAQLWHEILRIQGVDVIWLPAKHRL
jgi:hypothetical protein